MQTEIIKLQDNAITSIVSNNVLLASAQDAVDLIMNCSYQGSTKVILQEENIVAEFYDLKTGVAGEILQKFSTYQCQLAIVGDFSKYHSKSLNDFMQESNRGKRIIFTNELEKAIQLLSTID